MTSEFQKMAWANCPAPQDPAIKVMGSKSSSTATYKGRTKYDPNKAFVQVKIFGPQLPDD